MTAPQGHEPASQHGGFNRVFGIIAALLLFLPFAGSLGAVWETQRGAAIVPAIFGAGIVVCSALSWLQSSENYVPLNWRHAVLLCGFAGFGFAVWLGIPYGVATTLLIAISFGVIGRRSWRVMIAVWLGALLLAYGVFKGLLGIPVY